MEKFDFPFNSGMNPIFNILAAYAETDKQLGYTQGMNFLTALIFMATQDETITFAILQRVMISRVHAHELSKSIEHSEFTSRGSLQEWRFMFIDRMPKLTAFVSEIKRWLKETQRLMLVHLESRGIVLEAQLSSPFLSLFSNQIPN